MNQYQNISVSIEGNTALVLITRESKLNALNGATLTELSDAFNSLKANTEVKGVILSGSGEKAFVAGADIQEFLELDEESASDLARKGQQAVMDNIYHFPKPVIAAINGFALGGGLELALACHIRVAVATAKMGLPEVSLGIIPGYGGTQRLTALVGRGKALEMIMSGDMITAEEALHWGLVNHVLDSQEAMMIKSKEIINKMYTRSSSAISAAIEAVNAGISEPALGYEKEIILFGKCFGSEDMKEGVSAFLEKRKPKF